MPNSDVLNRHSPPESYAGLIRFRGQCAYLENPRKSDWFLLQFDAPFTGVVDPAAVSTTASALRSSYKEGDEAAFYGVLSDQSFGVVAFSVLFVLPGDVPGASQTTCSETE